MLHPSPPPSLLYSTSQSPFNTRHNRIPFLFDCFVSSSSLFPRGSASWWVMDTWIMWYYKPKYWFVSVLRKHNCSWIIKIMARKVNIFSFLIQSHKQFLIFADFFFLTGGYVHIKALHLSFPFSFPPPELHLYHQSRSHRISCININTNSKEWRRTSGEFSFPFIFFFLKPNLVCNGCQNFHSLQQTALS